MSSGQEYVAVIRLAPEQTSGALPAATDSLVGRLLGIEDVALDARSRDLFVWFNRACVSLGDIVRALEIAGLAINGVAQLPARSGPDRVRLGA